MKRYIKTDLENRIVDIFHERQKECFDGSEIFLDDVESPADVWINNKCIFDEMGNPIFKYDDGIVSDIDTSAQLLEYYKGKKRDEIRNSFDQQFVSGHFMSISLGIEVDCRRNDKKNDLQNVGSMIKRYPNLPTIRKHYVGYLETTSFPLTLEQLQALELEMIEEGENWYFIKRDRFAQIDQCTSKSQLDLIHW